MHSIMAEANTGAKTPRKFHRFPFEAQVSLYSGDRQWDAELLDISLKGLLLARPSDWTGSIGERYRAVVRLEGGINIGMMVTAAHCSDARIGCHCSQIDMASFSHLKRLIELNLGDTELLNRELEGLGPKRQTL
jgi:hypothetical protein